MLHDFPKFLPVIMEISLLGTALATSFCRSSDLLALLT